LKCFDNKKGASYRQQARNNKASFIDRLPTPQKEHRNEKRKSIKNQQEYSYA
jgi:hypothetical protein